MKITHRFLKTNTALWKKAEGELIACVFIIVIIGSLLVSIVSFSQLSSSLNELSKIISVVGRAVAVADDFEQAEDIANDIAFSVVTNPNVNHVQVSIEHVDEDKSEDDWEMGDKILVTVSANVDTATPYISGKREKKILVSVEKATGFGFGSYKMGQFYWPVPSEYQINSDYGYRGPVYDEYGRLVADGWHRGVDLAAPLGTPFYAAADGVVYMAYYSDSAGNFTIIDHGNGLYTEYMHQSSMLVSAGDVVKGGQQIGLVGSTGHSTGPHAHFGVVYNPNGYYDSSFRTDPKPYLLGNNN